VKILHVVPFFSPALGGSVEVPYQLCKELAKRGHQITIYTSDYKLDLPYVDSLRGVRVCSFRTFSSWSNLYITPHMAGVARKETSQFDIIHLHHFRTFQSIVAHHYTQKYGIPYVLQAHGTVLRLVERQRLKRLFDIFFGYRLLKHSARVIAVADLEVGQYQAMGVPEDKIETVPNAIDPSQYADLPDRGAFRRKNGIGREEKVVLYLGRIHKSKGIDLLVEAFSGLPGAGNNARLVIVGPDGGYLPQAKEAVARFGVGERVMFTGPLYQRDKLEAYVDADVYALSSSHEMFPLTVLEAWMCGLPVITTDRCGVADWVKDRGGYVVPYDPAALRHALEMMLANESLRKEFGEQGRKLVLEQFTWSVAAGKVEDLYNDVLRAKTKVAYGGTFGN